MKNQEIKFKNNNSKYSIFIGKNTLNKFYQKKLNYYVLNAKNIALII